MVSGRFKSVVLEISPSAQLIPFIHPWMVFGSAAMLLLGLSLINWCRSTVLCPPQQIQVDASSSCWLKTWFASGSSEQSFSNRVCMKMAASWPWSILPSWLELHSAASDSTNDDFSDSITVEVANLVNVSPIGPVLFDAACLTLSRFNRAVTVEWTEQSMSPVFGWVQNMFPPTCNSNEGWAARIESTIALLTWTPDSVMVENLLEMSLSTWGCGRDGSWWISAVTVCVVPNCPSGWSTGCNWCMYDFICFLETIFNLFCRFLPSSCLPLTPPRKYCSMMACL